MSSKNTPKPSDSFIAQLLEANQLLLAANQQFLARIAQLELDLAQAQARANLSAPPVVTSEKISAPELAFTDAGEMSDQPDFGEQEDRAAIELSNEKKREADKLFEEAFADIAEQIQAGRQELVAKGVLVEQPSASL